MEGLYLKKLLTILLVLVLIIVGCKGRNVNVSDKIIETIDNNCQQSSSCKVSMKEITDFKWDKMVIFEVGSSNSEISKALGIKYDDSTDLTSGMVFVYKNRVVYKEDLPYNPERPNKLWFKINNKPGEPNYWILTPNNAILQGSKTETEGVYYYEIKPEKTDNSLKK